MRKEAVDFIIIVLALIYLGRQLIGSVTSIVCEPLRDRVDQPNIMWYIRVQFSSLSKTDKHNMKTLEMKRIANFKCLERLQHSN